MIVNASALPLMYSYSMSSPICLNAAGISGAFAPARGIAPLFKHPLGAGCLSDLGVQLLCAVLEVIGSRRIEQPRDCEPVQEAVAGRDIGAGPV